MKQIERMMPHNLDAEKAVLGSCLLSDEAVTACMELVDASDFYRPCHKDIFLAMDLLYCNGEAIDSITVAEHLEANGKLERCGGRDYILEIGMSVPTAANAKHYAGIVRDLSKLRQLIRTGTEIVDKGFDAEREERDVD